MIEKLLLVHNIISRSAVQSSQYDHILITFNTRKVEFLSKEVAYIVQSLMPSAVVVEQLKEVFPLHLSRAETRHHILSPAAACLRNHQQQQQTHSQPRHSRTVSVVLL